jgi:stearoyl-CoA desaturase (delta-9 desaturase)
VGPELSCHKERVIDTVISPAARILRPRPLPTQGVPNWVKSLPFIGLHLACLAALFTGVSPLAAGLCAAAYFFRMFGITAGYHRYFAHRSYRMSRPIQFLMAWLGCSALQKGPLWWASHHRRHHRFSDTPDDPHSPHVTSFWWSHLGWIMSDEHVETPWPMIRDWSRFPELRWLDRWHWLPGLSLALACFGVGFWAGGWPEAWCCLVWGFVVSTVILYHCTFFINSLSHLIGKRRYATDDESRNNWFLALLTLGEGWHNNHHHFQSSANQGFFWWEIDISYTMLRLMSLFGLVWDLRRPGAKVLAFRAIRKA